MNMNFCYSHGSIFPEFYDIADEEGILVLVNRNIPYEIMWPKDDQFIYSKVDSELKQERRNPRLMNHPSQIGFVIDVWYNMHQGVMNPEYFGRKYDSKSYKTFSADGKIATTAQKDPNLAGMRLQRKKRLDHMAEIYRRHFPEFQSFTGGSGEVDGIYASHLYHTWGAQNLEMRAFFSRWGLQPDMPVFIGEYFIPYNASLRRIDVMHGPDSTPYYLENSARWFGNPAYRFKPSYAKLTMHDATPGTSVVSSTSDKLGKKEYYFQSDFYTALLRRSMEEQIPGFLYPVRMVWACSDTWMMRMPDSSRATSTRFPCPKATFPNRTRRSNPFPCFTSSVPRSTYSARTATTVIRKSPPRSMP